MFIKMYHLRAWEKITISSESRLCSPLQQQPSLPKYLPKYLPKLPARAGQGKAGLRSFRLILLGGEMGSNRVFSGPPYDLFTKVSLMSGNL